MKYHKTKKEIKPLTNNTSLTVNNFNSKLFNFIIWWEWAVQLKSFCDSYYYRWGKMYRQAEHRCKRFSIWYWTISKRWEVITKEEAHKRMEIYLKVVTDKIPDCWNDNQKIAIADMQYQFWTYYQKINFKVKTCDYKWVEYIMNPYYRSGYKKYTTGVHKRRLRWYNLFIKQ